MAQMSEMVVLKTFFGFKPEQVLKDFAAECAHLSTEEKGELARLAKAEMIKRGSHKPEDFGF